MCSLRRLSVAAVLAACGVGLLQHVRAGRLHVSPRDLSGRTFLVTGATSGLGMWHAERLVDWNATVVIGARDPAKAKRVAALINARGIGKGAAEVPPVSLDLASLASVRAFAEWWLATGRSLDVLVNNAAELGPVAGAGGPRITGDGMERCFQINYLSHFLLTELLLPSLEKGAAPRVVHVSAKGHLWGVLDFASDLQVRNSTEYDRRAGGVLGNLMGTYADSKLMQIMYSNRLGRQGAVSSHALHPAVAKTGIVSTRGRPLTMFEEWMQVVVYKVLGPLLGFVLDQDKAVLTQLHVSVSPHLQGAAPRYYSPEAAPLEDCGRAPEDCGTEETLPAAGDEALQEELYRASRRLAGLP